MQQIGIVGGTFNPIHCGHLMMAQIASEQFHLDKVLFIPARNPAHKLNDDVVSHHYRYKMVELSVKDNPIFEANSIEIMRTGVTYTIDTLMSLREQNPDAKLNFIIGADTLIQLKSWKKHKKLFELCRFLVYNRLGDTSKATLLEAKEEYKKDGGIIEFIDGPLIGISSTYVRNRIIKGKSIRYIVPDAVREYIETTQIYEKEENNIPDVEHLKSKLLKALTKSRYNHSTNVSESAVQLALEYGVDVQKAEVAGLMHDCAKCYSNIKKRKLAKKYGMMDKIYQRKPDLAHAEIGAAVAKEQYGIEDEEILSAIQKHTTGAEEMSLLDEIIYLADIIEVDRDFEGVDELRRLASIDLHQAVMMAMKQTVEHIKKKNGEVHPRTLMAYEKLKQKYQASEEIN